MTREAKGGHCEEDLTLYGVRLRSRLMLGTSQYPSPAVLAEAAGTSGADVLTVSLRRKSARLREGQDFWRLVRDIGVRVLPNTAGCYSVKEAVTTAQMAREVLRDDWVKLEVIGEADTLQPDVFGLVEAARILSRPTNSRCSRIRPRTWSSPSSWSKPGARC